jgi:probable O-glycosylation ligase (exosortase A-associated)
MRDLLLIAIVVLCAILALRRPALGALSFVGLGILNPHSMVWGFGRNFPFAQLIGICTILGYLFSEPLRFPRQRESFLMFGLWSTFGISTLFALHPEEAFEYLIYVSKILFMVFLCTALINTEQRFQWFLRVIALSLGFFGLKGGVFVIMTGGNYTVWGPEQGFLYANTSIGLALAMNIPLLLYLLKTETHPWLCHLIRAMMIFSYPAIVCTYSRGAWIGLAIVTALLMLKSKYKFLLIPAVGFAGMMVLPTLPELLPERMITRYDQLVNYQDEGSAQSRLSSWEFCKRVGLAHPVIGGGFNLYSVETYAAYFPEFLERYPGRVWSCHGIWHSVFAEHGIVGLIFWIGLLGSCFLSLRYIRAFGKTHVEMSWLIHCADMLQIALIAYVIIGTFLDVVYFDMFYYLVTAIVVIKEQIRRTSVASASAVPASVYKMKEQ